MKTVMLLTSVLTISLMGGEIMAEDVDCLERADSVFDSRDYEQAQREYTGCLKRARESGDKSLETEALAQIARCRLIAHDKEGAGKWLAQAAELASSDDAKGWSRYLGVKGRLEWQQDSLRQATATFKEMFDYCTENDLTDRAIDAVHMVAIVGTPDEKIEWSHKGIDLAESVGNTSWLGPLWNNLAITYSEIPHWEKCVDAFTKAREYHWRHGQEVNKLYADYHIGWALRMKGEHVEALKWLRPVLAWAERLENNDIIGQASQDIGEIQITNGETEAGLHNLRRALSCYEKAGYPEFAPDIYEKVKERIAELERQ